MGACCGSPNDGSKLIRAECKGFDNFSERKRAKTKDVGSDLDGLFDNQGRLHNQGGKTGMVLRDLAPIEAQKYEEIVGGLEGPFEDAVFPATMESLVDYADEKYKQYEWKRACELIPDAQIFADEINPNDIG